MPRGHKNWPVAEVQCFLEGSPPPPRNLSSALTTQSPSLSLQECRMFDGGATGQKEGGLKVVCRSADKRQLSSGEERRLPRWAERHAKVLKLLVADRAE
jgi:hypothetical protein